MGKERIELRPSTKRSDANSFLMANSRLSGAPLEGGAKLAFNELGAIFFTMRGRGDRTAT